jgi:hypothetical protein
MERPTCGWLEIRLLKGMLSEAALKQTAERMTQSQHRVSFRSTHRDSPTRISHIHLATSTPLLVDLGDAKLAPGVAAMLSIGLDRNKPALWLY